MKHLCTQCKIVSELPTNSHECPECKCFSLSPELSEEITVSSIREFVEICELNADGLDTPHYSIMASAFQLVKAYIDGEAVIFKDIPRVRH